MFYLSSRDLCTLILGIMNAPKSVQYVLFKLLMHNVTHGCVSSPHMIMCHFNSNWCGAYPFWLMWQPTQGHDHLIHNHLSLKFHTSSFISHEFTHSSTIIKENNYNAFELVHVYIQGHSELWMIKVIVHRRKDKTHSCIIYIRCTVVQLIVYTCVSW